MRHETVLKYNLALPGIAGTPLSLAAGADEDLTDGRAKADVGEKQTGAGHQQGGVKKGPCP
ncbi:MAG: hypothetical protein O3A51_14080 [Verrucomicrobia bacterium]|nr:hypothetical protein [Verrucomicrobiota bacterium]